MQGGRIDPAGQPVVVTQPSAGTFKCFTSICAHQCCTVGEVKSNTITCLCHGSQYSASTGAVTRGPATRGLITEPIEIFEGGVYLMSLKAGTCDF